MALGLQRLNAIDPRQRFTLAGLHGNLRWQAGGEAEPGQLAWDSAALFGIGLGHARLDFTSDGGQLRLREPVSIPVLQGQLRLDHLRWQPPAGDQGIRFALGATLQDLDLGSLSQRLGWPPFEGTISGRIPAARYEANVLSLDGGLSLPGSPSLGEPGNGMPAMPSFGGPSEPAEGGALPAPGGLPAPGDASGLPKFD